MILYFVPLYLEGMAQNWELILFFVGVLLIILEIFVFPGFGVSGILGIICIITSLSFAMIDNDMLYNFDGSFSINPVLRPFAIVILSIFFSIALTIWLASNILTNKRFSRIVLHTSLEGSKGFISVDKESLSSLVGLEGVVATDLKPVGTIEIGGKRYQAKINYGYASKGSIVIVMEDKEGYLVVRSL